MNNPPTSDTEKNKVPVGTLERGLAILQFFAASTEASLPDAAQATGLSRSTIHRITVQLRELGFLEVNLTNNRWRLGSAAMQLGVAAVQSTEVMNVAPERLQQLLVLAGEAVNLAVFDSDRMVLLYREQGPQSITISSRLGSHRPMHASALGKAFLAAMEDSEREVLIGKLPLDQISDDTITTVVDLKKEISLVQARGYAIDRSEYETTLACCAAAVFDHRAQPVAAISVSGPAERVLPQLDRIGGLVSDTAKSISRRLGYVEPH